MTTEPAPGAPAVEAPTGTRKASAPVALVLVLVLFVVALIALIQVVSLFGPTTVAAVLFPFHLAFFVFPAWVLLRLLPRGVVPEWLWPHPMRALAVGVLLLFVVVPFSIEGYNMVHQTEQWRPNMTFLFAAPLTILGTGAFLFTVTRARHASDADPVLSESVLLRALLRFFFGLFGGVGVLLLTVTAISFLGRPITSEIAVDPEAAAWFVVGGLLSVATAYTLAWTWGHLYSGIVRYGHARARNRRLTDCKALKGRLDDHYSLRRVGEPTFRGLRDSLDQEIDGLVPGEERFLRSREGIVRVAMLALFLVAAGFVVLSLSLMSGSVAAGEEQARGSVSDREYGSCQWCTSEDDWERYLAYPRAAEVIFLPVMVATFLLAAHSAVLVPLLVGEMRHARTEMKTFWDERRLLEERMLEEVRASSA
ncbi:MAG: hypothetical protein KY455_05475 [Euryarchaeota archaeon]|nr:hypothetical protein [Euryarchaeota archaeon]